MTASFRLIAGKSPTALEFFAGIGLARAGLEQAGFSIAWANDYETKKHQLYRSQYGSDTEYHVGDIADVTGIDLPTGSAIAWASSPCTDLSLAGNRDGLAGRQSGTFWHFVRILDELGDDRPPVAVLENVTGLASSHSGDDLTAAVRAFNSLGYSVDALAIDARHFIPQSRPRMFLVGALTPPNSDNSPSELRPEWLEWIHSDPTLTTHRAPLPIVPPLLTQGFTALADQLPDDDPHWWNPSRTADFLRSLSPVQAARLESLRASNQVSYRTAYRRTRQGKPVWEIRPDDIAGCLRTARGGSSRQAVVKAGEDKVAVRWMTPHEYASLMGIPDYRFGAATDNQIRFGFGDAVAVPVVAWLGKNYLMPLVRHEFNQDSPSLRVVAHG
ncbi:DNA cytosine methyltransferase [Schaalia odontolytica]|uniref:DNA (cytosine-5-)-methyltransferase n=1 Tax=Schaalia odontolytica TaxID=1660 RepID=A0A2X0U2J2_9ACTO|nr:DNA cytosine methyltransferase [Schaalia odontolytica]WMS26601.1 DNA cytosine methyltransferase [Schaalia odontolytica]SPT55386.1 Modification methylase HpaII [Schaalia odontolytica]